VGSDNWAPLREVLGEGESERANDAGRALSLDEVVNLTLGRLRRHDEFTAVWAIDVSAAWVI
jgi:hypothetical protein